MGEGKKGTDNLIKVDFVRKKRIESAPLPPKAIQKGDQLEQVRRARNEKLNKVWEKLEASGYKRAEVEAKVDLMEEYLKDKEIKQGNYHKDLQALEGEDLEEILNEITKFQLVYNFIPHFHWSYAKALIAIYRKKMRTEIENA